MKLIFARHGETENGKEKKFEGVLDSSLTLIGKSQAEKLAKFCLQENVKKIYSSPLGRAMQTAKIVSQILKIPVIVKEELKEICYGEFEGKSRDELEQLPIWEIRKKSFFDFVHPGNYKGIPGESYSMLYDRLIPFFKNLSQETEPVVIISHLGIVRCAKKFYENASDDQLRDFRVGNNAIYIVETRTKT